MTHDDEAVGLLPKYSVVKAGCLSNRPFEEIPVRKVMIRSSGSVAPGMPVRVAVNEAETNTSERKETWTSDDQRIEFDI